jgi:hypothetical protein
MPQQLPTVPVRQLDVAQQQVEWLFRAGSQDKSLLYIPGQVSPMTESVKK